MRLSYQPLTRRWRLNQSAEPFSNSGLGVALGQNYESLAEAIGAMARIARWRIADTLVMDDSGRYALNFQFRLDTSQLPRPLQLGAVGRSSWNLQLARTLHLGSGNSAESSK